MTNPMINPQPNYSGVTIQISNPTVNAGGNANPCSAAPQCYSTNPINAYAAPYYGVGTNYGYENELNTIGAYETYNRSSIAGVNGVVNGGINEGVNEGVNSGVNRANLGRNGINHGVYTTNGYEKYGGVNRVNGVNYDNGFVGGGYGYENPNGNSQTAVPIGYPPQYYLNNYNYQNNGIDNNEKIAKALSDLAKQGENDGVKGNAIEDYAGAYPQIMGKTDDYDVNKKAVKDYTVKPEEPQDFTKSQAVIEDLDARAAAEAEAKKNSKQKRVVALTDEYIKSLENYLNNPNQEIRLMASKEILTRLDEDKDRFNDAALNALLNKMLQDPAKLIRVAALSAFSSQLASGNDYTVQLLNNMQQNPNADKEDVIQSAEILLKMSAGTEIKNIPNPAVKEKKE